MKCPQKQEAQQLTVIDKMNKHIKTATCCGVNNRIHYFDFNDYINNDKKWFSDDGLHLTEKAYQMLDEKLKPVISKWALDS
jgi:lysophospholipase L1-like esterase